MLAFATLLDSQQQLGRVLHAFVLIAVVIGTVGIVGDDVTVEQARDQARVAGLNLIAAIDAAVGLDAVTAVLHLRGYVRGVSTLADHPAVIDGASSLILAVFGAEVGAHARTAIGVASLPGGACVELDLVAAVGS